jgi:LysM repeat protein
VGLAQTCSTYHSVASGETLSSISVKYNVSVQEIATANDLKEPYQIYVGQRLCIPGSAVVATATTTAAAAADGPDFTVKAGKDPFTFEIATVEYPANSPLFIRVLRPGSSPLITAKLGTMKTNKSGVAKRVVRLPKPFRDANRLTLCLKNAYTDDAQCKSFNP